MKKVLSLILSFVIIISIVSMLYLVSFAEKGSDCQAGDYIQFGTYPQSRVTDEALITKLNATKSSWKSYGYYSGSGVKDDGRMEPGDYMTYRDAIIDGTMYRAVYILLYRPEKTGLSVVLNNNSEQEKNGYSNCKTYWFKYEPIKWRVLDPDKGLIMSELLIDSQAYNNYLLYNSSGIKGSGYYGDSASTYWASNWYNSSIRKWLNDDFYNTAFSNSQKDNIKKTHLQNKSTSKSIFDSPDTNDNIFLLSYWDLKNSAYGFPSGDSGDIFDNIRQAKGTDYAKAQGLHTGSLYFTFCEDNSWWWPRSADSSNCTSGVSPEGSLFSENAINVNSTDIGVRPACNLLSLKNDTSSSWDCSDLGHDWDDGIITLTATCTSIGRKTFTCNVCKTTKSKEIAKVAHTYKNVVTKATPTADGKIVPTCSVCGAKKTATTIAKASKVTISKAKFVYNGKIQKPTLAVKDSAGKAIAAKYYTVKWSNASSKAVGSYTVTVTFKGNYKGSKKLTYTIVPKAVTGLKNAKAEKAAITLSWTKATGAKYYEVWGSTDGKTFKKIATPSTNTYKVTKVNGKALAAGKTYYFKVRALDSTKKLIGAYSAVLKTGTLTAAPTISKLTSTKSKTATVTWGKVTGAKSYTVYTSTDGKTFKAVKSGLTGMSFTLTKLTGGKKIYVKVRAVNAYGKASAMSAAKSVTVKK